MFHMCRLHVAPYYSSYPNDSSLSDKSFLMLSNHLRFGLPLLLFPGNSITITLCQYILLLFPIHAHMTSTYFYMCNYKRGDPYLCSAKAPVLEGSGSRRLYPLKCRRVDRVYVVFDARVDLGFFLLFVKNGFVVGCVR